MRRKGLIIAGSVIVAIAVSAIGGYAGYRSRFVSVNQQMSEKNEKDQNGTEPIVETDVAEVPVKSKEKMIAALKKKSEQTDPGSWKELRQLSEEFEALFKAYPDVENSEEGRDLFRDYFPDPSGIQQLPRPKGQDTWSRHWNYQEYFHVSKSDCVVTDPINGNETTVDINGFKITLGKTKISDLQPLCKELDAYCGGAIGWGLHTLGYREGTFDHGRSSEYFGADQTLCDSNGKSGGDVWFEILPISGTIIGLKVYPRGLVSKKLNIENHFWDDMPKDEVLRRCVGETYVAPNGTIYCGDGMDTDQIVFEGFDEGHVRVITYLLAYNRIQSIEE